MNPVFTMLISKTKNPSFVDLPYTATHFPTMPHPDYKGKTGNGLWADLLTQIDDYTGELLDKIDDLGIADNTIFIFTADNGPEALDYGETSLTVETAMHGSAGPWRGSLFTGYEGALRVPFVMRWPGKVKAGSESDEIVHAMDLLQTIPKIKGGNVPEDRVIDGKNVWPIISGDLEAVTPHQMIFYHQSNALKAVRSGPWKLLNGTFELYNLDEDIGESINAAAGNPDVVERLKGYLTIGAQAFTGDQARPAGVEDNPVALTME